jgi:pilus assembly protein Flp/PilA
MRRHIGRLFLRRFLRKDNGAQIIEYALIVAVVSIALVLALQPVFLSGQIGNFIGRLTNCLTATCS